MEQLKVGTLCGLPLLCYSLLCRMQFAAGSASAVAWDEVATAPCLLRGPCLQAEAQTLDTLHDD